MSVVDMQNKEDNTRYYGGTILVPIIASHMEIYRRATSTADAEHLQGV